MEHLDAALAASFETAAFLDHFYILALKGNQRTLRKDVELFANEQKPGVFPTRRSAWTERIKQGDQFRTSSGFYLDPPDKALVLSVDEKSQTQALDRAPSRDCR